MKSVEQPLSVDAASSICLRTSQPHAVFAVGLGGTGGETVQKYLNSNSKYNKILHRTSSDV